MKKKISKVVNPGNGSPTIIAGPNMKAHEMDITPEMQDKFNNLLTQRMSPFHADKELGRYDPYPCRS